MLAFGITSSVFDFATFWFLYKYFAVDKAQFRTGWFMESLATQILVVFIIRTRLVPFYKSKPSNKLIISTIVCLLIGWLLPYLPFAEKIGFRILPMPVIACLIGLIFVYLFTAEIVKRFIYRYVEA